MSDEIKKVRIKQDFMDDPLLVKPAGVRTWLLIILVASIALNTCESAINTRGSNELKRMQLEQAKRQYTLDSLRFEYEKQHPKQK